MKATLDILEGPDWRQDEDGWEHNAYKVRLSYDGRRLTVPWRAGLGITEAPSARDVLEALLMDAAGYENAPSFEEWAEEYGYDEDSRKAEATYRAVERQTRGLKRLLSDDYDAAVFPTEADGYDTERVARRLATA